MPAYPQLAVALRTLGADVTSAGGRPAMPDDEILSGSVSRKRVLITSDKDFGDLVFRDGKSAVGGCSDPLRLRRRRARRVQSRLNAAPSAMRFTQPN